MEIIKLLEKNSFSFFLRYNLHPIQATYLTCTIEWFWYDHRLCSPPHPERKPHIHYKLLVILNEL